MKVSGGGSPLLGEDQVYIKVNLGNDRNVYKIAKNYLHQCRNVFLCIKD